MKIVLINVKENYTPVPPLGLLYIGTVLKNNGHQVSVVEVVPNNTDMIVDKIIEMNPAIIGFSVMTTNYKISKDFNRLLQEKISGAYFCWGGFHPTALPVETMEENNLDFLVYGEGEQTMTEICDRKIDEKACRGIDLAGISGVYYFHDNEIHKNSPRPLIEDLDSLPFPDRNLLYNFQAYLAPPGLIRLQFIDSTTSVYGSRGCPFKCVFCAARIVHGCKVRLRSPQSVVAEMIYLRDTFNIKAVTFWDDTFAIDKKWIEEFCNEYLRNKLNILWCCQTRANIARHIDILKLMKKAGCIQVDVGCESGSDKILKRLKKGINRNLIILAFENIKKLKLKSMTTFIIGNPDETREDIAQTLSLAKKSPRGGVSFLYLVPYPGTPLYDEAIENDWFIDKNIVFDEKWTNKEADEPLIEPGLKSEEIVKIRKSLRNRFFLSNYLMFFFSFLRHPKVLLIVIYTVITNPGYIFSAIKKMSLAEYMERIYQSFNETLQSRWK